ncbi:MAG: glycosyl hydrolase [Armatimonadetes bacterium]|nr:glycosyl hydrolase [Armatimonadota bacterium]
MPRRLWPALLLVTAAAANNNDYHLATRYDWAATRGFYLQFENRLEGDAVCTPATLKLILGVADGGQWQFVVSQADWELERDYAAKATLGPRGAELWLDGKSLGKLALACRHYDGDIDCGQSPGWANGVTDYLVQQQQLVLSADDRRLVVDIASREKRPPALTLFEPNQGQRIAWPGGNDRELTLETTFRLSRRPDLHALAPFVDRYGQSIHADWPGKIHSDQELRDDIAAEDKLLAELPPSPDFDRYGGWLQAGWTDTKTGFCHLARRGGKWWLISPEGNPCFFTGVSGPPESTWERTPVSGREYLFAWLPPREGAWAACWAKNDWGVQDGTESVCLHTANLIRKYGPTDWDQKATERAFRRLSAFGLSGAGKWGAPAGLVETPVLGLGDAPRLARHVDIFDPAVQAKVKALLAERIGTRTKDPYVLGWSIGNEYDEIVTKQEIRDILKRADSPPSKRALLDQAVDGLHRGDLAELATAWKLSAPTREELYRLAAVATEGDLEQLRVWYERRYYEFLYRSVKELDPNHLYLGCWTVPGWWENEADWFAIAPYCDAIGYDRYDPQFADAKLQDLFRRADKPVLCGEFSYPPTYGGERGFGRYPTYSADDADAARLYERWVRDAAANAYCVGVQWFMYRDQDLTGRGPGRGDQLVFGEHYAFGLITVTDRVKWDLLRGMRATNLAAAGWRNAAP